MAAPAQEHSVRSEAETLRRQKLLASCGVEKLTAQLMRDHDKRVVAEKLALAKIEVEYRAKREALVAERNKLQAQLDENFWAAAILTSPLIQNQTTEADVRVLANVKSLTFSATLNGSTLTKKAVLMLRPNQFLQGDSLWIEAQVNLETDECTTTASGFRRQDAEGETTKKGTRKRKQTDFELALVALFHKGADAQAQMDLLDVLDSIELNGLEDVHEEEDDDEDAEEEVL